MFTRMDLQQPMYADYMYGGGGIQQGYGTPSQYTDVKLEVQVPGYHDDQLQYGGGYGQDPAAFHHNQLTVPVFGDHNGMDMLPLRCRRKVDLDKWGYKIHPTTVARRNERERNRVKHINSTFGILRQHLPSGSKGKKMSKVETLRGAIRYIKHLQQILDSQDGGLDQLGACSPANRGSPASDVTRSDDSFPSPDTGSLSDTDLPDDDQLDHVTHSVTSSPGSEDLRLTSSDNSAVYTDSPWAS